MTKARESELDTQLEELANTVAGYCVAPGDGVFSAEELGLADEDPAAVWYSSHVYGSNQGPSLDLIVAEDIGVTEEEELDEVADWGLADKLEGMVNDRLAEGGSVFGEDNCLFWQARA